MASPTEISRYLTFALSQIGAHNEHHAFEALCFELAKARICANVVPATGPVSAGGDQGRDFETFQTFLVRELGSQGAFAGRASEEDIAFICTTQKTGLKAKIRRDIAAVTSAGRPVASVTAFLSEDLPVAARHRLEQEARGAGLNLQILDRQAIASMVADHDVFWIAEQFLSVPAELRPERPGSTATELPNWYVNDRDRWHTQGAVRETYGEFEDLRAGLRFATAHTEVAEDLPFWIDLVRPLVDAEATWLRQRARYELAVATLRGLGDLGAAEDQVREFFLEVRDEQDPTRLLDASLLLLYVTGAKLRLATGIEVDQILEWGEALQARVLGLLEQDPSPVDRLLLLEVSGHLSAHPDLGRITLPSAPVPAPPISELVDDEGRPRVIARADAPLRDRDGVLDAWLQMARGLAAVPLFPVDGFARYLPILAPPLAGDARWRELVSLLDAAVARSAGGGAAAESARARAEALREAGQLRGALHELHEAKLAAWSGDTLRASFQTMLAIALIYQELRMPLAAKHYALAVAVGASGAPGEEGLDLLPVALGIASDADYSRGAWCGAVELAEVAVLAHDGLSADAANEFGQIAAVTHNSVIVARAAEVLAPGLVSSLTDALVRMGLGPIVENNELASQRSAPEWLRLADDQLLGRPFSDAGDEAVIRFAALGLDWTIRSATDRASVLAAESLAAAAQIILVEIADEDLCLLPTRVDARVAVSADPGESGGPLSPTGDMGAWTVTFGPSGASRPAKSPAADEVLIAAFGLIQEVSLLPEAPLLEALRRAADRGLDHKIRSGGPYDRLAAIVPGARYAESRRESARLVADAADYPVRAHEELRWQDGPGPGYSEKAAHDKIAYRYEFLPSVLRKTLAQVPARTDLRAAVLTLRRQGWKDWHILTTLFNARLRMRTRALGDDVIAARLRAGERPLIDTRVPEDASEPDLPTRATTIPSLDQMRIGSMLALVSNWGLILRQRAVDVTALERLLVTRYGYWSDDVEHEDPFPSCR